MSGHRFHRGVPPGFTKWAEEALKPETLAILHVAPSWLRWTTEAYRLRHLPAVNEPTFGKRNSRTPRGGWQVFKDKALIK